MPFPFTIHLYGLLVGLGILSGFWVAAQIAKRFTLHPDDVWDGLWWVVIPGIIGARLYHVLDYWEYYREHWLLIPAVWNGGLGIFGAIVGGVLGLWAYCWWVCQGELRSLNKNLLAHLWRYLKKIGRAEVGHFTRLLSMVTFGGRGELGSRPGLWPGRSSLRSEISSPRAQFFLCVKQRFLVFLDLAAFGLPLGQAIGRWGNFFYWELYGRPTALPWGIFVPPEYRVLGFERFTHFHPLFLYESLYSLCVFGVLLLIWKRKKRLFHAGSYFFVYLILYGAGRFGLEQLRIESWVVGGVNVALVLGFILVVPGVSFLYSLNNK